MSYKTYIDPREREDIRAHHGQDVWVVLNHVRAEKCGAFENFLQSILMPAIAHVHPETYNQVRVLQPTKSNADGNYTYIFLMDPVVHDGIYDISSILHEFYKSELADEYIKTWNETLALPQVEYNVVQSEW